MPVTQNKAKTFVPRMAVVYGFSASTYLLTWNLYDLTLKKPFLWGVLDHEYLFMGVLLLHAVILVFCFQERSQGELRWGSLMIATPRSVRIAKTVLTISLFYFLILFLMLVVKPRFTGGTPRDPVHWEIVFTSLMLVQTLYIGFFFLLGREKLLSKEVRVVFDWPALLGQLLRKIGR
jgi:hypothetical protein